MSARVGEDVPVSDEWGDPDPHRVWRPGRTPGISPARDEPANPAPPSFFPGPDENVRPWTPPEREDLRPVLVENAKTFGVTTAVLVLLGAPVAFLWKAVTPPVVVQRTAAGPSFAAPESDQMFAVDGWFVVVTLVVGLVLGALGWAVLRRRGPAAPFGLAAGGLLAALVTSAVGKRVVIDDYLHTFCNDPDIVCPVYYDGTLQLHSFAAVVVWPAAMLAAFAALVFVRDRERPPPPEDEPPLF